MTEHEKQLINDLAANRIGTDAFLKRYPVDLKNGGKYILAALEKAYEDKNGENVEYSLSIVRFDTEYCRTGRYVEVFSKLVVAPWHCMHENIASLLQGMKDAGSVDALYEAALAKFDYLDYDDTYALARKCIHALADIHTEASREKLRLLTESDVPIIREKAKKHLSN